jgi:uncharacterized protein (TIGR00255 family)
MTAFARQAGSGEWSHSSWEIRSVNHRYLEIALRLPEELRGLEAESRERVSHFIHRGKVDCVLHYTAPVPVEGLSVNQALICEITRICEEVNTLLSSPAPLSALELLRWPGVIQTEPVNIEKVKPPLLAILETTLLSLVEARRREGATLKALIEERCEQARGQIARLQERLPEILASLKERLVSRALELTTTLDPNRLEQEMLLLAQKLDVAEELDRLETHLMEVKRMLNQTRPVGRHLDFLMQEMNREANTLASKSAHRETTGASVELKVLIEQMREQVQNIE